MQHVARWFGTLLTRKNISKPRRRSVAWGSMEQCESRVLLSARSLQGPLAAEVSQSATSTRHSHAAPDIAAFGGIWYIYQSTDASQPPSLVSSMTLIQEGKDVHSLINTEFNVSLSGKVKGTKLKLRGVSMQEGTQEKTSITWNVSLVTPHHFSGTFTIAAKGVKTTGVVEGDISIV